MDGKKSFSATFAFSYKSKQDHLRCLSRLWRTWLLSNLAAFGAFWTVAEATTAFLDIQLKGWSYYATLIVLSIVISTAWTLYQYISSVPDGFESESQEARRIATIQRPKWEFQLALTLLQEKTSRIDQELEEIASGHAHVRRKPIDDINQYITWLKVRPGNLVSMVQVANRLLIEDLPAALRSSKDKPASPKAILLAVERIRRHYLETLEFEKESRATVPPEQLERVHDTQFGWSEPIRDGIRQMFAFLEQVCELDDSKDQSIQFEITFKEPPNIEEHCRAMDALIHDISSVGFY